MRYRQCMTELASSRVLRALGWLGVVLLVVTAGALGGPWGLASALTAAGLGAALVSAAGAASE